MVNNGEDMWRTCWKILRILNINIVYSTWKGEFAKCWIHKCLCLKVMNSFKSHQGVFNNVIVEWLFSIEGVCAVSLFFSWVMGVVAEGGTIWSNLASACLRSDSPPHHHHILPILTFIVITKTKTYCRIWSYSRESFFEVQERPCTQLLTAQIWRTDTILMDIRTTHHQLVLTPVFWTLKTKAFVLSRLITTRYRMMSAKASSNVLHVWAWHWW